IIVFGFTKAIANYFAGSLANKVGRKNILILGWLVALPIPFLLMFAPSWSWIIFANVLLGINQGLTWSSTVVMKIDLVGEKNRGLAMGLNEFSGYLAIALVALLSGYIAQHYGLSFYPFLIGIVLSILGLLGSIFLVKDTRKFVTQEAQKSIVKPLRNIFLDTSFRQKNLSSVSRAGLINNLNDGMVWGLLPILLINKGYELSQVGLIVAVYPAVWGISQLFSGRLADIICKKKLLFWGMLLQGIAIILLVFANSTSHYITVAIILGLGTAVVYPTFLAAIADDTHPQQRAESMGIFRFWRDSGYAFGAILSGILADAYGMNTAILSIGALTLVSAMVIQWRMSCRINIPTILSLHKLK
ncbi:MAG: MFS transporter, partial [Bacteroidetes bacterium]|nr:MFS transporter [Bacteroidota bacterium]